MPAGDRPGSERSLAAESFRALVYRHFLCDWLFRDASRGSRLEGKAQCGSTVKCAIPELRSERLLFPDLRFTCSGNDDRALVARLEVRVCPSAITSTGEAPRRPSQRLVHHDRVCGFETSFSFLAIRRVPAQPQMTNADPGCRASPESGNYHR